MTDVYGLTVNTLTLKLFTSKYSSILVELAVEMVDCVSLYIAAVFDYSSTWQKEKETFCSKGTGNAKSQPACLTTTLPASSNLSRSKINVSNRQMKKTSLLKNDYRNNRF